LSYFPLYSLGYPIYIVPFVIIPPIPSDPYLVFSNIFIRLILLLLSEKDKLPAIIAGSKACILILLGLEAKLAPVFINSS